jgi:class 3 adenylate cyclase
MPIFLDRHEMKGATAQDVAQAHMRDLEVQSRYSVKYLTYWFDEHRGTAFCLIDAPDAETAQAVHREAHGHVANQIVPVELSAVEAFLGRICDPPATTSAAPAQDDPAMRTIMFSDIVGSTEMTARLGDRLAVEIVRAHDAIFERALRATGGRKVKHTGDGIMASFGTAEAALDCGKHVQDEIGSFNQQSGTPLKVRIGIHCGEPIEEKQDLFGSAVQLAARICAAADADEILVSKEVRAVSNRGHLLKDRGAHNLKGFDEPVRLFSYPVR